MPLTSTGTAAVQLLRQTAMAACAVATMISPVAFAAPVTATNTTNFTTSTAEIDTVVNTPVTQQVNTFSTELIGKIQGGPVLFDQTLGVAFSDPLFVSAISSAQSVLTGNGAISFLGPNLLSSANTLSSNTQTVQTNETFAPAVITTQYVGPIIVPVGSFGICASDNPALSGGFGLSGCSLPGAMFSLLAGQTDFDSFILTQASIFTTTTTTNTDLLTQVYELDGVPAVVASVPEPAAWTVVVAGLFGLGFLLRRRNSAFSDARS